MLGKPVTVIVDRPLGSSHPTYPELYYPVNYGYIPGTLAPDGEEEDAYILGVNEPVSSFTGTAIAVLHREEDAEKKWIVVPSGHSLTAMEILQAVHFQEQFFHTSVQML